MDLRIISGKFKNKGLEVPFSASPITDRTKRSMFDTIGEEIIDARCLDAFAGSGNIGIEALSRGAKFVHFNDADSDAIRSVRTNLANLNVEKDEYHLSRKEYSRLCKSTKAEFDIIFLDPPFQMFPDFRVGLAKKVMNENTILVLKVPSNHRKDLKIKSFQLLHEKKLGRNTLLYMQLQ